MFQSLGSFVLVFLSVAVVSLTGEILPPQNVSVLWINDFESELCWVPQELGKNCHYEVKSETHDISDPEQSVTTPCFRHYVAMNGGYLRFSVRTACDGLYSKWVFHSINYTELVRNVQCYIHSSTQTHCSWLLSSHPPDFSFFYGLVNEDLSISLNDLTTSLQLQECSSYNYTDGKRTGCDLNMTAKQSIHMVFNGTLNNMLVRNTFKNSLLQVRPPPLNWTVIEAGDKFNISWNPPDILELTSWTFVINYSVCDQDKEPVEYRGTSVQLNRVSHCRYRIAVKAKSNRGETQWSEKYFDADTDPDALVYAAILIPLVFVCLAVLTFVCYRKNKENIFPKVPEPRDLLSDISDNNNRNTTRNLYIPAEEEEDCKITLVIDAQLSKLDS